MEQMCEVANEALLFLIRSIPKDADGDKGEMRRAFCDAQDWIHTLYAELQEQREAAMKTLGVVRPDSPNGSVEPDKIEHLSEEKPRNMVVYDSVKVAEISHD
jgi:hypothetical protein